MRFAKEVGGKLIDSSRKLINGLYSANNTIYCIVAYDIHTQQGGGEAYYR